MGRESSGNLWEKTAQMHRFGPYLMNRDKMIIADYCEKIGHHELRAAHAEEERRILQEELWRQKLEFREARQQSLKEMEELRKFQSSTFDTLARRKLIEDQNTIMELSGRVQELQNEVNCMNDSKDFQDAESVRSGNSHVTSRPMSFPTHPIPEGMLRPSFVSSRRKEGPPCIWDTHGISGNVFANPHASSSAPYPQELNPWGTTIEEPLHTSTAEKSERPEQNRDLRCQSGPSAKDSVIFSGGDSSKNHGADQQRLQISDLHFDKFLTPATFACWKIRFKTEVCTCSQFPTEAMQWIKEVELVDSVDELRSSTSIRGISMPNFEVLDARIASALNKIIHNSQFKRRTSLEEQKAQKQDSFLRGRQIAYLIYEYLLDKQEILSQPLLAGLQANEERQGNLLQEYEQRFEKLSEDQKLSRLCSEARLRLVEVGQFFFALPSPRGKENQSLSRKSCLEIKKELEKRMDPVQCTIWSSFGHKSFQSLRKVQY